MFMPRVVAVAPPPPLPQGLASGRAGSVVEPIRGGGKRGGAGLAEVPIGADLGTSAGAGSGAGPMACPTCRREFAAGVKHCPYDARRVMPVTEVRVRHAGSVCPRCRRGFDNGTKVCPHDRTELVPLAVWEAVRGRRRDAAPTGVAGKVCPQCSGRQDLADSFCRKDGTELLTVN